MDLSRGNAAEIRKWFFVAILFGERISGKIAANTYEKFAQAGLVSPGRIPSAGWHELVKVLGRGGYRRYDFKMIARCLKETHVRSGGPMRLFGVQ